MSKDLLERLINDTLSTGALYSELYYEDKTTTSISLIDKKIDKVNTSNINGLGIRLAYNDNKVYGYTNEKDETSLFSLSNKLKSNFNYNNRMKHISLTEIFSKEKKCDVIPNEDKKEFLLYIDKYIRNISPLITQVSISYSYSKQKIKIAKISGKIVNDTRYSCVLSFTVLTSRNGINASSSYRAGSNNYNDFINKETITPFLDKTTKKAIENLDAKDLAGGQMPVILASGFGGVIFHEACGHAMEATSLVKNVSVLNNKLNKQIASKKVNIIDDGTLPDKFGTTFYDDEGNITKRNILIKDGILVNYLVDELNSKKMKMDITSSGRRESYKFEPTSRMNNTFLDIGNDNIEDMIKSIKRGIYATSMGGGSVDTITGNFNFAVKEAYLIENGKITVPLKSISLIGNTLEILNNVEMVSNDFSLDSGYCGSDSGYIPVTIGQPTIKLSSILVGGTLD
ncbi:MAG: TldD/PmbA family protein [Bacilli bacterium]